jgi:ectoine hydroxylase-related dioxygenase (phytanoyl-CoA dioxygenase family)
VRIERIVWCGAAEPELAALGRDGRLLRVAAQILDSPLMSQLINQAHFKLPGDELEFPWHQDSTHRRYGQEWTDVNGRGSYVQTVVAVDDMTESNGPLEFLPGSCRWGHLGLPEGQLPAGADLEDVVTVTMPAGSVALFGPYTFHRSQPNRSSEPRRAFVNGFASPEANRRVYPGCGTGSPVEFCPEPCR